MVATANHVEEDIQSEALSTACSPQARMILLIAPAEFRPCRRLLRPDSEAAAARNLQRQSQADAYSRNHEMKFGELINWCR